MMKKDVVGSWNLESFVIEHKDGSSKPWGENMTGLLIYTNEDTISVSINSKQMGNDRESQFKSILFYAGTYEVKADGTILHQVTQASDLSRIGKEMIRSAAIKEGLLSIVGKGDFGTARITWRRR